MTTSIPWVRNPDGTPGEVWNPIRGCSPVSTGCQNCYAAAYATRFSGPGQPYEGLAKGGRWTGRVRLLPERLDIPLRWRKPRTVFVNSMSDLFHEEVPNEFIAAVFGIMTACPQHIFIVLTKRPHRMRKWFAQKALSSAPLKHVLREAARAGVYLTLEHFARWPLRNVLLGISAEDQKAVDERVSELLYIPSAAHIASFEPLLERVRLKRRWIDHGGRLRHEGGRETLSLIICGCESGPKARPFKEEWARSIKGQCVKAGIPFFYKQKMENGKLVHMPELDGRVWAEFPEVSGG